jgi:drug/metabolite transporter (DMT)-like permease
MIIAVLAAGFLKEHLSLAKAAAIIAGFLGVVLAVNPLHGVAGGDAIGYAACAVSALSFSMIIIWSRSVTQSETIDSLSFFNGLIQAGLCFGPALYYFKPLSSRLLIILLVAGVLNIIANLAIYRAIKATNAANVAQFHYTQIIFGAAMGYFIWQEIPTPHLIVGAVIIIVSGLYIAARARKAENIASVSPH